MVQTLMFTGELPVFVAGNWGKVVGRATGHERNGQVVVEIVMAKDAGLQLVDMLKNRVALGLDLTFSPTLKGRGGVEQEEDQDGAAGSGSRQPVEEQGPDVPAHHA